MAAQGKETRIPLIEIARTLEAEIDGADGARADQLTGLERVRSAKAVGLARERTRLAAKLGTYHARVSVVEAKAAANDAFSRHIALEIGRAQTEALRPDEAEWILHGRVLSAALAGVPNLTLTLHDRRDRWIEELGSARTNEVGSFQFTYPGRKRGGAVEGRTGAASVPEGPQLFLHVLDARSDLLHVDRRPVIPRPGQALYREIVLPEQPARGRAGRRPAVPTRPPRPPARPERVIRPAPPSYPRGPQARPGTSSRRSARPPRPRPERRKATARSRWRGRKDTGRKR